MIKIDDKEIRNPIEQIKKNMDDIEWLKQRIKDAYTANVTIDTEAITVSREDTNVPDNVKSGWLVDAASNLFNITGGNTNTLMVKYYTNIKGPTGPQGEDGITPDITAAATVSNTTGTPACSVVKTGSLTEPIFTFNFTNIKGNQGIQGVPGKDGLSIFYCTSALATTINYTVLTPKADILTQTQTIIPTFNDLVVGSNGYLGYIIGIGENSYQIKTLYKLKGETGQNGQNGQNGLSVYEAAVPLATSGSITTLISNIAVTQGRTLQVDDYILGSNGYIGYVSSISGSNATITTSMKLKGENGQDGQDGFSPIITVTSATGGHEVSITDATGTETFLISDGTSPVVTPISNGIRVTVYDEYGSHSYDIVNGQDGLTTDINVNGNTYTQVSGTITLPDYPDAVVANPTLAGTESDLTSIQIGNTKYAIPSGGSGNSSSGIYLSSADLDTTVNYNKVILISTIDLGTNTLAINDIIIGANKYVGYVTTIGVNIHNQPVAAVKTLGNINDPDLSNYVTTTALTTTLADYELKADAFSGSYNDLTDKPTIPTKTSDLTNDSGFITGITSSDVTTALGYTPGTSNFSGDYDDLTDKPDLSNFVTSSDLQTELQNYVESSDLATVATSGDYSDLIGTPTLATVATTGDYDDLINKPTIPTVDYPVTDVQVDGVSVVNNKIASITMPTFTQVQSDWTQSDNTAVDYIKNKPTIPDTSNMVTTDTAQDISGSKTLKADLKLDDTSSTNTSKKISFYTTGAVIGNKKNAQIYYNTTNGLYLRVFSDTYSYMNIIFDCMQLKPYTNNTTDLGTTSYRWKNIFLQGYLSDGNNANYGLKLPDTTSFTTNKTIATTDQIPTLPTLATVATTGDYDDLINKPTIPTDVEIIELTNTSGTLSATDFAKVIANPNKVMFAYKFTSNGDDNYYYLRFTQFVDDDLGNDKYEYMSTMYYSKNYQVDITNNSGSGQYSIYEVTVNYNELSNKPTIPTTNDINTLIEAATSYKNGDKFVNADYYNVTGYLTNGGKEISIQIVTPKNLDNINTITVDKYLVALRGVAGYVNGNGAIDYAQQSDVTITATKSSPNTVYIKLLKTTAFSGGTNNTPINVLFAQNGGISLTFNE